MKKTTILSILVVALFGLNLAVKAAEPTNFLDQHFYGAESAVEKSNMEKGWYFPAPNVYSLSNEKAATGTYSLKFYVPDVKTISSDLQGFCGAGVANPSGSKLTISDGSYEVSIKVFIGNDAPYSIMTAFGDGSAWTQLDWNLSKVAKNQWVTLTKTQKFSSMTNAKLTLKVKSTNLTDSGTCTLFIDDISIVAKN